MFQGGARAQFRRLNYGNTTDESRQIGYLNFEDDILCHVTKDHNRLYLMGALPVHSRESRIVRRLRPPQVRSQTGAQWAREILKPLKRRRKQNRLKSLDLFATQSKDYTLDNTFFFFFFWGLKRTISTIKLISNILQIYDETSKLPIREFWIFTQFISRQGLAIFCVYDEETHT